MAKSLTIKNKNNQILYPKTVAQQVYDDADGITVKTKLDTLQTSKQDLLVSGTNIKTINNSSILGNGNIEIIGEKGDDGLDAYQPFKGWYTTSTALSNAFSSPKVGDFAYVKGSTSADPVAIYECVTAGTWTDSGREFNPANNQEFASGEALNETNIVNDFTGGVGNVLSAEVGKTIQNEIDDSFNSLEEICQKFYTEQNCSLGSTYWYYSNSIKPKHIAIPVTPDTRYILNALGTNSHFWCFVTSSYSPPYSNNGVIPFVSSQSKRQFITAGESITVIVPSDAAYLILTTVDGSGSAIAWGVYRVIEKDLLSKVNQANTDLYGIKVRHGYKSGWYIVHSTTSSAGNISTNASWAITDRIPVVPNDSIRIVFGDAGASGIACAAFYDENMGFSSTFTSNGYAGERTITIGESSTVRYVIACFKLAYLETAAVYINDVCVWNGVGELSKGIIDKFNEITGIDNVPMKNSTNLVKSGGIYDEFENIKNNAEIWSPVHYTEINLHAYINSVSSTYINMTNNCWLNSASSKAAIFAIKPNTKYRLKRNSNYAARYALLTSNDQTLNSTPAYATGETLHQVSESSIEFITPPDTRYITINYTLSQNVVWPDSLEEVMSIGDCFDEIKRLSPAVVKYNLAQRFIVDGRVSSETFGQVIYALTSSTGNDQWGTTQLIDLFGVKYVKYYTNTASTSDNFANVTGTVFYNENKEPMTDNLRLMEKDSTAKSEWVTFEVPTGARYMRVTMGYQRHNSDTYYAILYRVHANEVYGLLDAVNEVDEKTLLKNVRYGWAIGETVESSTTDVYTGTVNFLHFSDIHSDKKAAEAIRAYYDKYSSFITDMLSTGDVVYYDHDDDFTFYTNNNLTDALFALGNHDGHKAGNWNSLGEQATYAKYFEPYISGWGVTQPTGAAENYLMYYYKDYTTQKVRLIVLDGQHQTADQLQWFTDTLADANTNEYTVVVASHYIPSTFLETGIVKKSDGDMVTFHNQTASERTTIDTRFKLATTYANAVETFIANGGKFAIWLCGHYHADYLAYCNDYTNVLFSAINQAGYLRGGTSGSRSIGDPCANIVSISPRYNLIKIVRFGLKSDRFLRPINVLTYNYDTHKVITNY